MKISHDIFILYGILIDMIRYYYEDAKENRKYETEIKAFYPY